VRAPAGKSYDRLRWVTVLLLVGAAVLSALGNSHRSVTLRTLALACFLGAVFAFAGWRRAARAHRARVFDREAKTSDETRAGPDR
jgi:hypothetical protein